MSEVVAGSVEPPEDEILRRIDVERVLDSLSQADREMLWLFYYQRWTIRTIAARYGVPASTVGSRLMRARDRFRRRWESPATKKEGL